MNPGQKLRNVLRGVRQVWGTSFAKRNLWNSEFAGGRWDYIDRTPEDCVYPFLKKYCRKGAILDLGCGSGNTGTEINLDAYEHYTGVDISDVAIEKAISRSKETGRAEKNQYFQSDILDYVPRQQYDVILFRESLFYVSRLKVKGMLARYAKHLTPGGVIVVRMCDRTKYAPFLDVIAENFQILEKFLPDAASTIIVVFR